LIVFVRARHHVGTAADHGLQRLGATGKVDDLDVEPFFLEVAQALGDRQRQVVEQVLAPTAMVTLLFSGLPCACALPNVNQPARNSASAISTCFQNFLLYIWLSCLFYFCLIEGRAAWRLAAMLADASAMRIGINT
jgi:hypothetical protein